MGDGASGNSIVAVHNISMTIRPWFIISRILNVIVHVFVIIVLMIWMVFVNCMTVMVLAIMPMAISCVMLLLLLMMMKRAPI